MVNNQFLNELFHIFNVITCCWLAIVIVHEHGNLFVCEPCALVLIQVRQIRRANLVLADTAAFLNAVGTNIRGRADIDNPSEWSAHILDIVVPHLIQIPFHGIHHAIVLEHLGKDVVVRFQATFGDEDTGANAAARPPGLNLLLNVDGAAQQRAVLESVAVALNVLIEDLKEVLTRLVLECLPCADGFINEVPVRVAFLEGVNKGALPRTNGPLQADQYGVARRSFRDLDGAFAVFSESNFHSFYKCAREITQYTWRVDGWRADANFFGQGQTNGRLVQTAYVRVRPKVA